MQPRFDTETFCLRTVLTHVGGEAIKLRIVLHNRCAQLSLRQTVQEIMIEPWVSCPGVRARATPKT